MKTDILTIRQYFPSKVNPTSSYWVMEQIKEMEKYGLNSVVVSPTPILPNFIRRKLSKKYPEPSNSFQKYMGIDIIRPGYFRIPNYKFYSFTNLLLQRSVLAGSRNVNPKLIHAHFGNDGVAAIPLKKKLSIPLVVSFYGYDLGDQLSVLFPYYKKLINEGDLFLALSNDMKKDLQKIGFPENKIKVHRLGVNYEELNKYENTNSNNRRTNFLIPARLNEYKGIQDSILAFSKVIKSYPLCKLRIIGNGPIKYKLIKLINKLQLEESISIINNFLGANPRKIMLKEMSNSDIILLTSFTTADGLKEGTPVVLMEAQAMGKPCISTKHAGIPEIVLDNKTGILCKERCINEIVQAMFNLIENKSMYCSFSDAAKKHINKEFNNKVQSIKLFELYKSLCNSYVTDL